MFVQQLNQVTGEPELVYVDSEGAADAFQQLATFFGM